MQRNNQPILILTCQHDSHFFEERTIVVSDVIKVGRAVARSKASPTNAIFDCKVLSRNHAVIWFTSDEVGPFVYWSHKFLISSSFGYGTQIVAMELL